MIAAPTNASNGKRKSRHELNWLAGAKPGRRGTSRVKVFVPPDDDGEAQCHDARPWAAISAMLIINRALLLADREEPAGRDKCPRVGGAEDLALGMWQTRLPVQHFAP